MIVISTEIGKFQYKICLQIFDLRPKLKKSGKFNRKYKERVCGGAEAYSAKPQSFFKKMGNLKTFC